MEKITNVRKDEIASIAFLSGISFKWSQMFCHYNFHHIFYETDSNEMISGSNSNSEDYS